MISMNAEKQTRMGRQKTSAKLRRQSYFGAHNIGRQSETCAKLLLRKPFGVVERFSLLVVRSLNFAVAKQFLSHFVDHLTIGYTLSRVAFCQFTPMLRPEFYFGNYFDLNSIKRSIVYANFVPCVNEMTCSGQIAVNK
uniref:Uncharacterized protein n=1 Tax=Romanomermis culicivorax TaxID=13658 RepID=A0A915KRV5_ROMCU